MRTHIIINIMIKYVNQLTNQKYVVFARSFCHVLDDICVLLGPTTGMVRIHVSHPL